jgi:phosphonate transport system substrate-binding protein
MFDKANLQHNFRYCLAALLLVLVGACGEATDRGGDAVVVRVSVLPDQDKAALERRHRPLINYLQRETGYSVELNVPDSYEDLNISFEQGSTDIAWFGGLTYVRAAHGGGAEPLVMRDVDSRFVSHFIVRSDAQGEALEDFRGALLFGPRLSTSGHLMPRYFLEKRGIEAAEFFGELRHTSGHDETVQQVLDGRAEIGAVNSEIMRSMLGDGRLPQGTLRVLEITPPFANYVWAVHESMDPEVKARLQLAFLGLDIVEPSHRAILDLQGAGGFMPAAREDFFPTAEAAIQLGLLGETP